ncbi:MAG: nucleotide pyrophosphohydrolase [Ferrimicrobium sp.]
MIDGDLIQELRDFVTARDWGQFHTPENLAKSIAIEAGELLECYQWGSDPPSETVAGELADVITYCCLLADRLGLEITDIVRAKLEITAAKYPVEKARGRAVRYDRL